ncbi:peptidoglycan hydrolase-like protein with peptidoglycan-binding domain [Kitasatospora sp. MAA19]|uniref:peptidoglycan-binding domain-containing protein n=1 Tax=unclassified Kitasatospora TaxID=2633591 RepID=UPI002475332C|nr:peptidoglycan-binding domain-containing protein [Kitasatospora sp. MAA19]MDH6707386.1 peptidoglycan hydrolase-like protein with peptidoglycan-binding domain [Kitasatospora sp. MAA19]
MRTKLAAIAAGAVVFTGLGVGTATTASASTPAVCSYYGFTSDNEPQVSYGDSGAEIKALQCELNYSVRGAGLQVDGIFGDNTLSIVKKFQGCAGLQADGIVGPKTWAALDYQSDIDTAANYIC